jgi:DNA-binding NarL/FixJ family response regulator
VSIGPQSPIRILIADDHRAFRDSLRQLCAVQEGFQVVGEAENGREAIELARRLEPDMILMDLRLPGLDAVAATATITQANPAARVIVLTTHRGDGRLFEALHAGALGYLPKDVQPGALIEALRAAHRGEALLDPRLTARLFEAFRALEGRAEGPRGDRKSGD